MHLRIMAIYGDNLMESTQRIRCRHASYRYFLDHFPMPSRHRDGSRKAFNVFCPAWGSGLNAMCLRLCITKPYDSYSPEITES